MSATQDYNDLGPSAAERTCDMLRADQAALMAALHECGYLAQHPDDKTLQRISEHSRRVLANTERHNDFLAERDQARADAANLRDMLAEAEVLIRDLALGADQRSQSHADVLAKIAAYDAAALARMPEPTPEETQRWVARGMAIVRRLMEERCHAIADATATSRTRTSS